LCSPIFGLTRIAETPSSKTLMPLNHNDQFAMPGLPINIRTKKSNKESKQSKTKTIESNKNEIIIKKK
jgi:hypothetical protein